MIIKFNKYYHDHALVLIVLQSFDWKNYRGILSAWEKASVLYNVFGLLLESTFNCFEGFFGNWTSVTCDKSVQET